VCVSIYCCVRGDSCIGYGLGPLTLGWFTWFGCGWVILLYLILLLFVVSVWFVMVVVEWCIDDWWL